MAKEIGEVFKFGNPSKRQEYDTKTVVDKNGDNRCVNCPKGCGISLV